MLHAIYVSIIVMNYVGSGRGLKMQITFDGTTTQVQQSHRVKQARLERERQLMDWKDENFPLIVIKDDWSLEILKYKRNEANKDRKI